MTEYLPSDFTPFGHVVGRVIRAVGDTPADPDADPEAIPVTGTGLVRFTPLDATRVVISTSPDTWVAQETIAADLDNDGLLSVSGSPGVSLWPGAWKVSAGSASVFSFPTFTIEVTSAHTAAAPLELWSAAPWTPGAGQTVTTLVVPSGGVAGQVLGWDGSALVWTDGGTGEGSQGPAGTVTVGTVTTGAAGSQATVTNTGTPSAAVLDFTIPRGSPGTPGSTPANPEFTATASTLAAGSSATASVTGTYPALNLALGIPRGADGTGGGGSALQIVAAGRPDITSTMDAATQAAVSAATVGTEFVSTSGDQGAWVWRRRTTGWVCVDGDTGVRALLRPGSSTDALMLRRIGATVSCTMGTIDGRNLSGWSWGITISGFNTVTDAHHGFIPDAAIPGAVYADGKYAIPVVLIALPMIDSGVIQLRANEPVDAGKLTRMRAEPLIWNTSDSWPSTLPGTAF